MRGVIDRIEDGIAVILIESLQKEWTIDAAFLPEGSEAGTVLQLTEKDDTFDIMSINHDATAATTEKAQSLQQKLKKKKKQSKFKRK